MAKSKRKGGGQEITLHFMGIGDFGFENLPGKQNKIVNVY